MTTTKENDVLMTDDLPAAVAKHYTDHAAAQRDRVEDELRRFRPDPALDAALQRMDAERAANPRVVFGSIASSLENYRRRRDAAAALATRDALDKQPTGDNAA